MTRTLIEAVLRAAIQQCEAAACPLSQQQQQVLLQVLSCLAPGTSLASELIDMEVVPIQSDLSGKNACAEASSPLDQLTPEQRYALLEFVQQQEQQSQSWKVALLNDWLHSRHSGPVQFIRDDYGPHWLDRVQPVHLARALETDRQESLGLKVGDRIEVCNGLWEWVQEAGPCKPEWFPCTVIVVREGDEPGPANTSCTVRFENGAEYEIQSIYDWNRYNWRWPQATV